MLIKPYQADLDIAHGVVIGVWTVIRFQMAETLAGNVGHGVVSVLFQVVPVKHGRFWTAVSVYGPFQGLRYRAAFCGEADEPVPH